MNPTASSILFQDGNYQISNSGNSNPNINLNHHNRRRVFKTMSRNKHSFYALLKNVGDGRSNQGKRHSLSLIILILFIGLVRNLTTVKDCRAYACDSKVNKFLKKVIGELPYGIPQESTISYAISLANVTHLVQAANQFWELVYGYAIEKDEQAASFDGKTMRGVHGKDVVRHILSIFTHRLHQTIAQIGVLQKENEIPAMQRLLPTINFKGLILIGDALHGQTDTSKAIIAANCDYLLFIKGNQPELQETVTLNFNDPQLKKQTYTDYQDTRGRHIHTEVNISNDVDLKALQDQGWQDIQWIGKVHRWGAYRIKGEEKTMDETVYFISSRKNLTTEKSCQLIRNHWKIENNLHWQKDVTYQEDKQRLAQGNAPQVMTFLRSMCIGLFKQLKFDNVADATLKFKISTQEHLKFIKSAGII